MLIGKLKRIQVYSTHVAKLPVREAHIVQLGRGDLAMKSLRVFGRVSVVIRMKIAPLLTSHHVGQPGWIGFMIPLSWEGDYVFNGQTAHPGDVFLTSSSNGYFNAGQTRNTLMFVVQKSAILSALSAMTGVDPERVDLRDRVMPFGKRGTLAFERLFATAIAKSEPDKLLGGNDAYMSNAVETDLIEGFVRRIAPYLLDAIPAAASREWKNAMEVVRSAEDAFEASPDGNIGLSDLCRAAGVGITRLTECYHELYGVPPSQHIKNARLTSVRLWLLDGTNGPRSVKDAARAYGFTNSGRFARYYLDIFGELPSETLARSPT